MDNKANVPVLVCDLRIKIMLFCEYYFLHNSCCSLAKKKMHSHILTSTNSNTTCIRVISSYRAVLAYNWYLVLVHTIGNLNIMVSVSSLKQYGSPHVEIPTFVFILFKTFHTFSSVGFLFVLYVLLAKVFSCYSILFYSVKV